MIPDGFVLSVNVHRRHMSKGAIAMAVAKVVGPTTSQGKAAATLGVSRTRVMQACVVLDHRPDLADDVLAGTLGLDKAWGQREVSANADIPAPHYRRRGDGRTVGAYRRQSGSARESQGMAPRGAISPTRC
jgi:hypothetical protein